MALLIVLLSAPVLISLEPLDVKTSQITVKKISANSYTLSFRISYDASLSSFLEESSFLMPAEEILIHGTVEDSSIHEQDFLFSQLNIDLNGDGDTLDIYPLIFKAGKYMLEKQRLQIVSYPYRYESYTGFQYFNNASPRTNRITQKGKEFIVYAVSTGDKKMTVGLNLKDNAVAIEQFPNPAVQIAILKNHEDISSKPGFSIAGSKNYITFTNEKLLKDQADSWVAIVWTMLPVKITESGKTEFQAEISRITPPFTVMAVFNISPEKNIRLRSIPIYKEVEK
jgi:hypothetical protein